MAASLATASLCACATTPFSTPQRPSVAELRAVAPRAPEPHAKAEATAESRWASNDRSAKAPLRKKLVGVFVAGNQSDALTARLLVGLMGKGFTHLSDLSAAPAITAEITRTSGGGLTKLASTLDQLLAVASPVRAEYVLLVRFASLPATGPGQLVRFELAREDGAAYAAAHKSYIDTIKGHLAAVDKAEAEYEAAFATARAEYEAKKGGYQSFPTKTAGQVALEEREVVRQQLSVMREAGKKAMSEPVTPEALQREVDARTEQRAAPSRVVGTATLVEAASSRVAWLAMNESASADPEALVVKMLDQLPAMLP